MALRGPLARLGPAALVDDHGLAGCGLAQHLEETPAVPHPLDIGGDQLGFRVLTQIGEELVLVDVQGVAVAHHLAEAKPSGSSIHWEVVRVPPALGEEADRAGFQGHAERVQETALRHVEADAVGSDDPEAAAAGLAQHLPLQLRSLREAALAEAGREEVDGSHPLGGAVVQQREGRPGRDVHHHVIHDPGDAHQVRIAAQTHHLVVLRVDGIDGGEAGLLETVQDDGGEAQLPRSGGADHGDSAGCKDVVQ